MYLEDLSGVSGDGIVLSTDGCLVVPLTDPNRPAALAYLSTLESLLGGLL